MSVQTADPGAPVNQDPDPHRQAYWAFGAGLRYVGLFVAATVTFLTLAFCTQAGLIAAIVATGVEILVGLFFARPRKPGSWQSEVAGLLVTTQAESGRAPPRPDAPAH